MVRQIIRNRFFESANPRYHGPLIPKWQDRDALKTYLGLRRLYELPGDSPRPFVYRLPLYKRLHRFFQRNRQFVRKLYGQMRQHHLSKLTKKLTQTNDKKRRRMRNLALYLENNASGSLIMNRFFPAVKELRQLIRNKKLLVNEQPNQSYIKQLSRHDVVHLDEYKRQNGQVMLNNKWRHQMLKKLYKMRYMAGGFSIALYRMNMFNDPLLTGGVVFNPDGADKVNPMAVHLAVIFQHYNMYLRYRHPTDPAVHMNNNMYWKSPFFYDQEVVKAVEKSKKQKAQENEDDPFEDDLEKKTEGKKRAEELLQ